MAPNSVSSFRQRPATRLGWWAFSLAALFVLLFVINSTVFMRLTEDAPWQHTLLPFYGIFMLLCGLSAGITGLIAILGKKDHSWMVWLSLLPGSFVLVFLIGEFLVPH